MVQFFLAVVGGDSYPYTFNGFEKYFIALSFKASRQMQNQASSNGFGLSILMNLFGLLNTQVIDLVILKPEINTFPFSFFSSVMSATKTGRFCDRPHIHWAQFTSVWSALLNQLVHRACGLNIQANLLYHKCVFYLIKRTCKY